MVSIITPCHNAEKFIGETIESVLKQTYDNWELIVVDDGSTDGSADIVKRYQEGDSRIKYFRIDKASGSPSKPRNLGIENSKGNYIAFLDSDDLWLEDKLEKQVAFMQKRGINLSYSFYEKIDDAGCRNDRVVRTRMLTSYRDLLKSNSIPCLTAMVRRDVVAEMRFKEIPQEDFCFWLDILRKGYVAHNLGEVTALYREAKGSRSANKLAMFKGYWDVIRKEQEIGWLACCRHMVTYTVLGFKKYLK